MGDLPLRTPTHRRLGGPLPRQPANAPHGHPPPINVSPPGHAPLWAYGVLVGISTGYPPVAGRFHTCYSPVRRSPAGKASFAPAAPRLACVRPVASVHPEPGSNSSLYDFFALYLLRLWLRAFRKAPLFVPSFAWCYLNMSMFVVSSPCFGEANRRAKLGGFLDSSKSFFQEVFVCRSAVSESECKGRGFFFCVKGACC